MYFYKYKWVVMGNGLLWAMGCYGQWVVMSINKFILLKYLL